MTPERYLKNNGMSIVFLFAKHPMKDYVLIGSGIEDDCRWVPFDWFFQNFRRLI